MRLAVINTFDAKDKKNWAGIPFYLVKMMQRMYGDAIQVIILPPFKRNLLSYLRGILYNKVLKKKYYTWADNDFISYNKVHFEEALIEEYDIIITFQFYLVPFLKTPKNKVIYWNDATFKNLINFYAGYSNLSKYADDNGHLIQKQAFDLSDLIVFSSDWAIDSAKDYYRIDAQKLFKIPFASNLGQTPNDTEVMNIIKLKVHAPIIFIFLAVDWERKGGEKAIQVINLLNENGYNSELYVVGTDIPTQHLKNKSLKAFGFIDKNSKNGESRLVELLEKSSFLILPTYADCTPVVFSEANSFGLPVITTNVGGVSSAVKNNANGFVLNLEDFSENAFNCVLSNLPGTKEYDNLCHSSYKYYKENLSGQQVESKFNNIIELLSATDKKKTI